MLKQLKKEVKADYFLNDQWLKLTSHYEDDGKLTEQLICLIDGTNECIFCIYIRTFSDMDSGWESQPYLIYNARFNEFRITIPKFGYITPEDIKKAIRYIICEYEWYIFNIKIDGKPIEAILEEWRFTKEPRWTGNFTPPTEEK